MMFSYDAGIVSLLAKYPEYICWDELSCNPAAIKTLESNMDKINWSNLSLNPAAMHLLQLKPDCIDWKYLSANPSAVDLLSENVDKIDFDMLSMNPGAIDLLSANQHRINWKNLSGNPEAKELILANMDKVDTRILHGNPNFLHIVDSCIDPNGDAVVGHNKFNIKKLSTIKCTRENWLSIKMQYSNQTVNELLYYSSGDPFACQHLLHSSPKLIYWVELCRSSYWDPYYHAHLFDSDSIANRLHVANMQVRDEQQQQITRLSIQSEEQSAAYMQLCAKVKQMESTKLKEQSVANMQLCTKVKQMESTIKALEEKVDTAAFDADATNKTFAQQLKFVKQVEIVPIYDYEMIKQRNSALHDEFEVTYRILRRQREKNYNIPVAVLVAVGKAMM